MGSPDLLEVPVRGSPPHTSSQVLLMLSFIAALLGLGMFL